MRTTVTLDADVEAMVKKLMRERGLTFKQAVNRAIRNGLSREKASGSFRMPTYSMGKPNVDIDKALRIAGDLEDAELKRNLSVGK